jgi:hypothetical protein
VEQASTAYGHHLGLGHPQEPGGRLGELGHARGVAVQVGRLEVDDVGEATGDLVELTLGDRAAQAGFGGDHGDVEVVEPFQLLQQLAPGAGERAGHVRVEDPSRPSPDGLDGRVRSEVGEGHRRMGDRREACRQRELLATEAVWPPRPSQRSKIAHSAASTASSNPKAWPCWPRPRSRRARPRR